MTIRPICEKDKSELIEIMTEFYSSPAVLAKPSKELFEKDIADCLSDMPFVEGYVAECDGVIAGYTMVSKGYSTERGGICVQIEDLFFRSDFRGNGVGEKLLSYVEQTYKNVAARLRFEVEPSNLRALKLYERCGFSELLYKQMIKELNK